MRLQDVKDLLDAVIIAGEDKLELDFEYVFGCDLMSDVLTLSENNIILLTGLTNIQTVRTAEMMDIKCIVYVGGKVPDAQVISLAKDKGICLMCTKNIMFNSCGILYNGGLKGAVTENGR